MTSGTSNLLADVGGTSSSDVFAVGNYGTIVHYNGSAWSGMSSGNQSRNVRIWWPRTA